MTDVKDLYNVISTPCSVPIIQVLSAVLQDQVPLENVLLVYTSGTVHRQVHDDDDDESESDDDNNSQSGEEEMMCGPPPQPSSITRPAREMYDASQTRSNIAGSQE